MRNAQRPRFARPLESGPGPRTPHTDVVGADARSNVAKTKPDPVPAMTRKRLARLREANQSGSSSSPFPTGKTMNLKVVVPNAPVDDQKPGVRPGNQRVMPHSSSDVDPVAWRRPKRCRLSRRAVDSLPGHDHHPVYGLKRDEGLRSERMTLQKLDLEPARVRGASRRRSEPGVRRSRPGPASRCRSSGWPDRR